MLDRFRRFLSETAPPEVTIRETLTIVALLDCKFDGPSNQRTRLLMREFARIGDDQVQVIIMHKGIQRSPVETPDPALPNLKTVPYGTDIRPLYNGRVIMWTDAPEFAGTLATAHPNLVVYDDREKGINSAEDAAMHKLADLVFSYDLDTLAHPKISFISSTADGAAKALLTIQKSPNRKPPRQ
ncbi:hypothetical protein ACP26L_36480 (plasmid) [Paenibacillus sp. S-38]|uniref:hypothetical protein n=1 Tax=Paenibacillus sp. S-38 TaxID=3416710 RepID=UPI003CF38FDB